MQINKPLHMYTVNCSELTTSICTNIQLKLEKDISANYFLNDHTSKTTLTDVI